MSLHDAFGPAEEVYRQQVIHSTWGHLAPKNRKYFGQIHVAVGVYKETIIIESSFPDLPNSPWEYESLQEILFTETEGVGIGVYVLVGWLEWGPDPEEKGATTMIDYEFEVTKLLRGLD